MVGMLIYMAPEVLRKEIHTEKSDVYSFGVTVNELLEGVVPYNDLRAEAQKRRKKKSKGVVLGSGPRTRLRASRITLPPTVKQVNEAGEVEIGQVVEANDDTPKVSTAERLKLIRKMLLVQWMRI
ncbi:hypothetical protein OROMI_001271 [Orobanche minor]